MVQQRAGPRIRLQRGCQRGIITRGPCVFCQPVDCECVHINAARRLQHASIASQSEYPGARSIAAVPQQESRRRLRRFQPRPISVEIRIERGKRPERPGLRPQHLVARNQCSVVLQKIEYTSVNGIDPAAPPEWHDRSGEMIRVEVEQRFPVHGSQDNSHSEFIKLWYDFR